MGKAAISKLALSGCRTGFKSKEAPASNYNQLCRSEDGEAANSGLAAMNAGPDVGPQAGLRDPQAGLPALLIGSRRMLRIAQSGRRRPPGCNELGRGD